MLMGPVRVLPCISPEQLSAFSLVLFCLAEIFSLDILRVCEYFIVDVPMLNFESPDVATKKYGRLLYNSEGGLLNCLVIPIPIS